MIYDVIIIGGGIVGASTAWQLKQKLPDASILLLEKENDYAKHQTGHNSGVIHAGVYYTPGSLKAEFCRRGVDATLNFCREENIKFDQCGKLLVATSDAEMARMQTLFARCAENGIDAQMLSQIEMQEREPNITGLGGFFVPSTGIVSYGDITRAMAQRFIKLGGEVKLECEVINLQENADEVIVETNQGVIQGKYLISCSGLMADRVVKMLGIDTDFQIIPFRGEYFQLPSNKNDIVNHLIYPIPDPELPFLGVHLTRMIDGSVTVGPNAVLGFAREGYKTPAFNLRDTASMLAYGGFWKLMMANWKSGVSEMKNSLSKSGYLQLVRKYCPELDIDDLQPYPAGIRAQAVTRDGTLVHDFLFAESTRSINICNAPSPAATSSIPIGAYITEKATTRFFK